MRPDCFPPHPAGSNLAEIQGVGRVGYGLQHEILKAIILMIFTAALQLTNVVMATLSIQHAVNSQAL